MKSLRLLSLLPVLGLVAAPTARAQTEILNASYDISRELFVEVNAAFVPAYKASGGGALEIKQSHAGSSRQARSILEGLKADVVTFKQVTDVRLLADNKFVVADWAKKFPNASSPCTAYIPSSCVRAVRRASRTGPISPSPV